MEQARSIGLASYHSNKRKAWIVLAILFVLVVSSMLLSLSIGDFPLSFLDTIKGIFNCGSDDANITIWENRMPRILGAVVCGSGLALSGCIMQSCLRNPLASPSTIGVSNAATFGANVAIIGFSLAGISIGNLTNSLLITFCSFGFAILAVVLVMGISKFLHFSPESIILAGTALSALCGAGTTILQSFADDDQLGQVVFWTFGNLKDINWMEICIIFVVLIICFIFFMFSSWNYNVMSTGEETSKSLGLKTGVVRVFGLLLATLLTAVIVSFVGMIGFLGLVAPQIMKRIVGQDHRFLIPCSALTGSLILVLADFMSRVSGIEFPIGAITSLIGAPMFIVILLKGLRKR